MSTITGNMKFVDENGSAKYINSKKIGGNGVKTEIQKRGILGELQNRALPRAGTGKDAAQKDLKDAKLPSIRTTKARVDTHWKKGALPGVTGAVNNATKATTTISSTKPTRAAGVAGSKVITRSDSLRLAGMKKPLASAASGIQPQATAAQTKEIKTVTTKMVENKLQQVKVITKGNALPVENKLRREDSNISRESLTKLKAALAREGKAENVKLQSTSMATANAAAKAQENAKIPVQTVVPKESVAIPPSFITLNKDVRNIDEGDEDSLILVSEYVNDIYEYLFQLEIEQPIRKHHLANQKAVTPKMRAVLLDWINEVHAQFHLVTETFHMTVGIIDRYLQVVPNTERSDLQLVGVTALFLAAKYEELYPPAMADFIYMTDHSYTQEAVLEMEILIFRKLDYNLSRPIPIHFLRRFSKAADVEDYQHAMSKYFLELAAIEYELSWYKPSEIAAAALFLSLHMSKGDPKKASGFNDSYWNPTLQYYSHYSAEHLRPITRKIASIARQAREAKMDAVYTKYQSSKLYKASLNPVLYSALMDSIIDSDA